MTDLVIYTLKGDEILEDITQHVKSVTFVLGAFGVEKIDLLGDPVLHEKLLSPNRIGLSVRGAPIVLTFDRTLPPMH
ncbi:hypothetical protein [Aggregatilinea lenta]|uniref:hypothetical protein n=1 Tax=Aggregatilinea lenta TaxID=913108 RepID=UPI000E5C37E5|nr:hypothetical protein [Aggregatilinea lenta]